MGLVVELFLKPGSLWRQDYWKTLGNLFSCASISYFRNKDNRSNHFRVVEAQMI